MQKPANNAKTRCILGALLVVATLAAYWGVLGNGFIESYDDGSYVLRNSHVRGGLSVDGVRWAFSSFAESNWHPLTWVSHMADVSLFGMNPGLHHLTNLLFQAASALLLFVLLNRMTGAMWKSAFVAAVFALHPLHVESVAWVAERKDVLSVFFAMLTLLAYYHYASSPNLRRYLVVLGMFALGLLAKPMLVSLPILLLLLDIWPLARVRFGNKMPEATDVRSIRFLLWEKVPLFVLSAVSCVVTFAAQRAGESVVGLNAIPLGLRLANALVSCASYVLKMLWPAKLAVLYPYPSDGIPAWQWLSAGAALVVVTVISVRAMRTKSYMLAGWLWYLITLAPVIGLVQVGRQAMADRYTYIPMIGLLVIIAWGLPELLARRPGLMRVLPALAVVSVLASAILTHQQVGFWRNDVTLFEHALAVTKDNYLAHYILGKAALKEDDYDTAEEHYREAIRIRPRYVDAYNDLGITLAKLGRHEEAGECWEKVLEISPGFPAARSNLAHALASQGRFREAVLQYTLLLKSSPRSAALYNSLGLSLAQSGRVDEAIWAFSQAIKFEPRFAEPHSNLATALVSLGRTEQALRELRTAVKLDPEYVTARDNLGQVLTMVGKRDEAIAQFTEAAKIQPDFAPARMHLIYALFDSGRYADAWREVSLSRQYGIEPDPQLMKSLAAKMPPPR